MKKIKSIGFSGKNVYFDRITNPRPIMENRLQKWAYISIVCVIAVMAMIYAKSVLIPIVISAFLAMLLVPINNKFEKWGIPRIAAITISVILIALFIAGIVWIIVIQVSRFSSDLDIILARLSSLGERLYPLLDRVLGDRQDIDFNKIGQRVAEWFLKNLSSFSQALLNALSGLSVLILIPFYLFMFLLYRDHFVEFSIRLYKNESPEKVRLVVSDLRRVVQLYLSGVLKVMGILVILYSIGLTALGIRHAIFFAIVASALNIIPYIGPWIGSLLPMIFALLTKESLWYPIGVLLVTFLIQTVENNYLTPKVVGSNVQLNPIVSFIALIVGGLIWGIAGMIIFIPAFGIVKKLFELSPKTEAYAFLLGEEQDEEARVKKSLYKYMKKKWDNRVRK